MQHSGDKAFRRKDTTQGHWQEMTYGGALSFLRRNYGFELEGINVTVTGLPYDNAVTYRPGCRLGPRGNTGRMSSDCRTQGLSIRFRSVRKVVCRTT